MIGTYKNKTLYESISIICLAIIFVLSLKHKFRQIVESAHIHYDHCYYIMRIYYVR